MESLKFTATESDAGLRLDQAISANSLISRGKSRRIIDLGGAYVNKKRVRRSSSLVKPGDKVAAFWRDHELERFKNIPSLLGLENILFEDIHFIVINKPHGLPSQGTKTQDIFHVTAQLGEFLKTTRGRTPQLRIAHRLDRDTTGVMVLCKTKTAYKHLSDAFQKRKVKKEYHTICGGIACEKQWIQDQPLGKIDPIQGRVYVDFDRGLPAKTEFTCLSQDQQQQVSLICCHPITGRTHQIRAHLEFNYLPIVGDKNYSRESWQHFPDTIKVIASRHQMLHAKKMSIPRLRGEGELTFSAPYPSSFTELAAKLNLI